jgi:hypothetical protein
MVAIDSHLQVKGFKGVSFAVPTKAQSGRQQKRTKKFEQKDAKITKSNQDWVRGCSWRHFDKSLLARVTFDERDGNRSKRTNLNRRTQRSQRAIRIGFGEFLASFDKFPAWAVDVRPALRPQKRTKKFEQKDAKITKSNQDWVRGCSWRHSTNSPFARTTFDERGRFR